ncbi:GDSL-type esterase/lipase family protein [Cohnella fermenti]|nr:GDSL-type esterase/lipase family protein [Cohnella fermenti]
MEERARADVSFHNAYPESCDYLDGLRLKRYPAEAIAGMEPGGKLAAGFADGCEIRFASLSEFVNVTLFAEFQDGSALVYKGDHFCGRYELPKDRYTSIRLQEPPGFARTVPSCAGVRGFSREVWRIHLQHCGVVFCGIEASDHPVRVPRPDELPERTMLAYGSSITQGSSSLINTCGYVFTAGRLLGADVLNKGMGGSCVMERSAADSLARMDGWDFAWLELGVNMVRERFTVEQLRERTTYLLHTLLANHPEKMIFITSIFPNFHFGGQDERAVQTLRYMEAIKEVHRQAAHPRCVWIDSEQIMSDASWLSADLLHPSTEGHAAMGFRLAEKIGTCLPGIRGGETIANTRHPADGVHRLPGSE